MTDKEEEAEGGKKKEPMIGFYDSYQELFEFFCNNTTIHGTIRMVCSKHNNMKTVSWTILFITTFGVMYWQFGLLLGQYYSYPVSITMSVNFDKLIFPAVTVCTLNPYRYNVVSTQLANLDCYTEELLSTLYHYNPLTSGNQSACNSSSTAGTRAFDESYMKLEFLNDENTAYSGPVKGATNSTSPVNHTEFYRIGFKLCNATGEDCFYQTYSSGVDALREWYKFQYINIMAQIPSQSNQEDDSQISNFVYACEFNKVSCGVENYTRFRHPVYGNCYTYNDGQSATPWASFVPGVGNGLSLVLRTEQNDFLPFLSTVAGARVLVHDQNQPPFMEDSGLDIRPGVETSIGMKKEIISRLGGVYGNCTDGSDIDVVNLYNSDYNQQACVRSCFQATIVQQCGCGYYFYPLPSGAEYCSYSRNKSWGYCYYKLYKAFAADELGCFRRCRKPCQYTDYKMTAGYAQWPSSVSESWITSILSQENQYNMTSGRKNIAKLNVYFYELNYQTMGESPSFTVVTLLSNMGSQWSLWFGSSVLSVVEMGELVFDLIAVGVIVLRRRRREKCQASSDGEGTSDSTAGTHRGQENASRSGRDVACNRFVVVAEISPPPAYDTLQLDVPVACAPDCECTQHVSHASVHSQAPCSSQPEQEASEGPTVL
uniref:Epithelial sodium channel subunit alpha n=1 Tax=Neoceratodus forsteri TaxID=7892 RepID=SCNNA_NEOFS|nr:RecName: Full=Amiloride-sensitive sodium channel subunit alpha; AltName: Full=Alpha-NaCH; AltName: Full=Epithelial Na(+) channel subunit alpha; Short=Alpha-ENaC; AltName: Full=Nonvoltage-gated sodium channel 1 subunit alpha; AltName: Full=SCNEA [Neoceratodus forsteri]BAL46406.1 epithelial sodium channel subunit alpha [Neoceratodus forsteri]